MKKALGIFILSLQFFAAAQVNTFSLNVNGTPPAGFTQALTIAAQKWSNYLQITVPIKVNVFTVSSPLLPFSAIALANGRQNFTNTPNANILYPTALANQIAGVETNVGEYDMDIYFNLASAYYYGSGKPATNEKDFISTAMHEMGHGLGFYSDGYVDGTGKGSFGNIPPSSIFPLTPSFPWRGQDGVPSVYDKHIIRFSNNYLTAVAANNSTALGDSIKNGAVYFNGPLYANPSHSNTPVRLSGGAGSYTLGVDLLHIHDTYANTIMSYYWGNGDTVRIPAPWELGILKEIGWNLKLVGLEEYSNYVITSAFPNPVSSKLYLKAKNISEINLYSATSELVISKLNALKEEELIIDTQELPEGVYFLKIAFNEAEKTVIRKIIVQH